MCFGKNLIMALLKYITKISRHQRLLRRRVGLLGIMAVFFDKLYCIN